MTNPHLQGKVGIRRAGSPNTPVVLIQHEYILFRKVKVMVYLLQIFLMFVTLCCSR